jgi:1-deoxy-D-xylulose 5-phosphate reductoisomerase
MVEWIHGHMKKIAILGSTGSIGTQALDVVRDQPHRFQVELLTCGNNVDLLIKQALEFKPNAVVIGDPARLEAVKDVLFPAGIKAYAGAEALEQAVTMEGIDLVLTALVGYAGLRPTLAAIAAGKHIALANKETLVVAGELVHPGRAGKGGEHLPRGQRAQRHLPMPGRRVAQPHREDRAHGQWWPVPRTHP